ncbi:MAG: hypothetical protein ACOC2E_09285, partial [Bacteroidota bacterium]
MVEAPNIMAPNAMPVRWELLPPTEGNFKEERIKDVYDTCFTYADTEHQIQLSEIVKIHIIELTKLHKLLEKARENVESLTDKEAWTIFLTYGASEDFTDLIEEIMNRKEGVKMAG